MDFSGIGEPCCLYYKKPQSRLADNSGSKTGTFRLQQLPGDGDEWSVASLMEHPTHVERPPKGLRFGSDFSGL